MRLRGMHSALRPYAQYALDVADYYGIPVTVTSVYRSWSEQQRLRARYERGESKWPANRPGDSAHNWGFAFDSWTPDEYMPAWTAIRREIGWEVLDHDIIHAQLPQWREYLPRSSWPRSG